MTTFQYRALQANGSVAEGVLEASGRADAFKQMESRGLRPISLAERNGSSGSTKTITAPSKPAAKAASKDTSPKDAKAAAANAAAPTSFSLGSHKVTPKMLESFTRLLSSLLAAGVPLSQIGRAHV